MVFEVKWAYLDCREVKRIASSLEKRLETAAERIGCKPGRILIIARSAECRSVDGVEVHTLEDMPFEVPRDKRG